MYDEELILFRIIDIVQSHIALKVNIFVPSIKIYNKNNEKQHNVLLKSGFLKLFKSRPIISKI